MVVLKDYNGAETFLSPSDVIAIMMSQHKCCKIIVVVEMANNFNLSVDEDDLRSA